MSDLVDPSDTSPTTTTTNDVIGVARLLNHLKENNVSWMIAALVAFQLGILQELYTYGTGLC